jgi:cytochrome c oxidase subunit II
MTRTRLLGLVPLFAPLETFAAPFQNALLPSGVQAGHIYDLWLIMLWTCTVVFIAIVAAFGLALWRAPKASETTPPNIEVIRAPEPRLTRAVVIGATLSIIGLLGLLVASVMTDRALANLPLKDGVVIQVAGQQWWWQATYYPDDPTRAFDTANELHIPVGRPVLLKLESPDVIHSFWVPNLTGKKDLIPGHTLMLQLRADKPGIYRGQCAEFCGYQHAKMGFLVIAEEAEQYEQWAQAQREPAKQPTADLQKRGQQVFLTSPCVMCHAVQGTSANAKTAPDLTHLASRQTIAAGVLPNTKGHLAGWIVNPQQIKPGTNMPAITLPPADLQALLAYLETLQ